MKICVLRRGGSPESVAAALSVPPGELLALNGMETAARLPPGLSLVLPEKRQAANRTYAGTELYEAAETLKGRAGEQAAGELSFISAGEELWRGEQEGESAAAAGFCGAARSRGTLPLLRLSAGERQGEGDERLRQLMRDGEERKKFFSGLCEGLEKEGWAGLELRLPALFPFEAGALGEMLEEGAALLHGAGLWLTAALPLRLGRDPGSPDCRLAAAKTADRLRLIIEEPVPTGILEGLVDRLLQRAAPGRLLLQLPVCALLERGGEREYISAGAAQNLALSVAERIYRPSPEAAAEFEYRDAAGCLCRVRYGDALWLAGLGRMAADKGLAGLGGIYAHGQCPGGKKYLAKLFRGRKFL